MPKMYRIYYTPTAPKERMFQIPAVMTTKGKDNRLSLQSLNCLHYRKRFSVESFYVYMCL